jgi:hypothetical protein
MDPKAILKTRETFGAWYASTSPKEPVFPNQLIAARRVLRAFVHHHNQALLWAKMQSGKTGTYQVIITFLLACAIVDHAYILCGSAERTLHKQVIHDVSTHNARFRRKIDVLFRGDLDKHTEGTPLRLHRTLIVVDESHMDQTKHMTLPRALDAVGLDLSGSAECHAILQRYGAYILTVDATPYSEVCAMKHIDRDALREKDVSGSIHKTIIRLEPGEGYVGVKKLLRGGHIKSGGYISENREAFIRALKSIPGKYAIVRVTDDKGSKNSVLKNEKTMREICADLGFPVLRYTGEHKDIAISADDSIPGRPSFADKPATTTVVMVKGCLRAGKRVPKSHLGLVWVCSKTPNTDTLLQGLLGRCCGYYTKDATLPDVYISPVFLAGGEREADLKRYFSTYTCPSHATNVNPIGTPKVYATTQTPAVFIGDIIGDNSLHARIHAHRKETGTMGFPGGRELHTRETISLIQANAERLLSSLARSLTPTQMEEIRAFIPTLCVRDVAIRSTQIEWASSVLSGALFGETAVKAERIQEGRKVALIAHPEKTMLVFYTHAGGHQRSIPLEKRFGKENGQSVFSPSEHPSPPPLEPYVDPKTGPKTKGKTEGKTGPKTGPKTKGKTEGKTGPKTKGKTGPKDRGGDPDVIIDDPSPNGVNGDPDVIIDDPSPNGVNGDPGVIIDDPSPNGVDGDPGVIIDDPSPNGVDGDPDIIIDDPPNIQPVTTPTSLWLWLLLALIGLLCIFAMYVHVNNQPPSKYLTLPVENAPHDPLPRWHTLV